MLVHLRYLPVITFSALFTLIGCQSTFAGSINSESPKDSIIDRSITVNKPEIIASQNTTTWQPGTYCYQMKSDFINTDAIVTFDTSNRFSSQVRWSNYVSDDSHYSHDKGKVDGDTVYLYQQGQDQLVETAWQISPVELYLNDEVVLQDADCVRVRRLFDAEALIARAERVRTEKVRFGANRTGTMIGDAAVRGDRIVYLLSAASSQQMYLTLTSVGNNAAFDLVAPDGTVLNTESTHENIVLPQTGEYKIIVGATRGNANYDLAISIAP